MRVHVFGASGMLGNYVYSYLKESHSCIPYTRSDFDAIRDINKISELDIAEGDVVINCIGIIKPQIEKTGELNSFVVNSFFPILLAKHCKRINAKMIHVTTDCVFSGSDGPYGELDEPDQLDTYGLSKKLGETDDCCVIRTSIIGEEKDNSRSLVEWAKSEKGNQVFGFTNHFWNGITCLQFAKIVEGIIESRSYWRGVRHVFTQQHYNKLEMVQLFNDVFDLELTIVPKEADKSCNRTLETIYRQPACVSSVPDLKKQIEEMKEFNIKENGI